MMDSIRHIKNPLTLISIFAGVAEVSGAAILPLLDTESQKIFIYFPMLFPTLTVSLFFLTLNFNHKTLYAPSDYKDEKNFVNPFGPATSEELVQKLNEETTEVQQDSKDESDSTSASDTGREQTAPDPSPLNTNDQTVVADATESDKTITENNDIGKNDRKPVEIYSRASMDRLIANSAEAYETTHQRLMENVARIESLAVEKLSLSTGLDFHQNTTFRFGKSNYKYVFDAAAHSRAHTHVAEVKLFTNKFDQKRFVKFLEKSSAAAQQVTQHGRAKFTVHLVVILDSPFLPIPIIRNQLSTLSAGYGLDFEIHIATVEGLESDFTTFH